MFLPKCPAQQLKEHKQQKFGILTLATSTRPDTVCGIENIMPNTIQATAFGKFLFKMNLNQKKTLSSNPIPRAWSNHKSIILSVIGLQQLCIPSGVFIGYRDSNSSDNFIRASCSSIKTGRDDGSSGCFYLTKFRETS